MAPHFNRILPIALCGNNPKLSTIVIRTRNTAATPTGFLEIVSDDVSMALLGSDFIIV
jgi:hypothetical protein